MFISERQAMLAYVTAELAVQETAKATANRRNIYLTKKANKKYLATR